MTFAYEIGKLTKRNRVIECDVIRHRMNLCFHVGKARPHDHHVATISQITVERVSDTYRTFDWCRVFNDNAIPTYMFGRFP